MGTLEELIKNGLNAGIALIPIIPYMTDNELDEIIFSASNIGAKHFLHKSLELKGKQKSEFLKTIDLNYPNLKSRFENLYKDNFKLSSDFENEFNKKITSLCKKYNLPKKIDFKTKNHQ
jgi:DNA repair photolyase